MGQIGNSNRGFSLTWILFILHFEKSHCDYYPGGSWFRYSQMSSWEDAAAAAAKSLQLCPTLCDPIDGSPPGSPVPGILQARTLEWVGCHFLLQCMKVKSESEVAQSCPTLSDPMDCSPPGSSVHGILQARVLEWGAIAFSTWEDEGSPLLDFLCDLVSVLRILWWTLSCKKI